MYYPIHWSTPPLPVVHQTLPVLCHSLTHPSPPSGPPDTPSAIPLTAHPSTPNGPPNTPSTLPFTDPPSPPSGPPNTSSTIPFTGWPLHSQWSTLHSQWSVLHCQWSALFSQYSTVLVPISLSSYNTNLISKCLCSGIQRQLNAKNTVVGQLEVGHLRTENI